MWVSFGHEDIGAELRAIHDQLDTIQENQVATNDELQGINAKLTEAGTEIPALLEQLVSQVGDQADPALVAEIKAKATALADIVPNAEPVPEPAPEPADQP